MTTERLFAMPQQRTSSDDHYTPKHIFDVLNITFDLDVASPPGGIAYIPSARYYTQEEDGLSQPWQGRVWMNPPYSNVQPWIDKWLDHANGIALLPCVKHSRWVETLWNSSAKVAWINRDEVKFSGNGIEKQIWPIVWLWAIGKSNEKAIEAFGRVR